MILSIKGSINNKVGRNNMAKSKKKKNFKLRRRVKRTIAALTMVMAIVVAAIPVENYGTMQASGVEDGVDLKSEADNYFNDPNKPTYKTDDKESVYQGDIEIAQHIEGDVFIDAYRIQLKTNNSEDAMIKESVFKKDLDKFDIYDVEYYGYIQMDADYIKAVENTFDGETYSITYDKDSKSYSAINTTITDASGQNITLNLSAVNFDLIKTDSPKETITNSPTGTLRGTLNGNPYDTIKSSASNSKIFENYAPEVLKSHTDKIDDYNKEMQKYIEVLEEIKAKSTTDLTQDDERRWNDSVTAISALQSTGQGLLNLTKTFAEIRAEAKDTDEDENDLPDIVDYAICQRLESSNNTGDLVKYGLIKLINQKDAVVYVPKNNSPNGPDSNQVNDEDGYLAKGKANIKGIASNAFDIENKPPETNREVGTITIPDTVEFIGVRAFANSKFLKDVTLDDTNCTILADEAFMQCPNLASIKFTSANSRLETIGCKAFYNTKLDNIIFPPYVKIIGAGCLYLSDIREMSNLAFYKIHFKHF